MHKYYKLRNFTSVIAAAEFTHSQFDSRNWQQELVVLWSV